MRTGIWLIGARGSVGTTATLGAAAMRAGLVAPTGCVTARPDFASVPLTEFGDLVFGGHELVDTPLLKRAEQLVDARVVPPGLPALVERDLRAAEEEIRPSPLATAPDQRTAVEQVAAHLAGFRHRNGLDTVVVVNVSSTEAPLPYELPQHTTLDALRHALGTDTAELPPSSLYAMAAFTAGCPYVDFTPSTGARLPALAELAEERRVPYAGHDGKTGETLVKSVLAPMFARRALRPLSWSGTNLLGGGDGATLAEPDRADSKIRSKRRMLAETLGEDVHDAVHIHHVPDLGDWKTAWDHVTFEGFLGARMTLQFTWQGCDSALAAPLVLDLARLTAAAHRAGLHGPLAELAFFFKDPLGTREHGLERQYDTLVTWAHSVSSAAS
ncbi:MULTISPECIES: inositol-3-phosphate synthase [Nonomuraea]|uniref:inositol-3-phosphate synthase n=1 Tax=Nonomuraea sp. NPDC049504 TaxID=3154729 RepID=UPI0031EDBC04